jgi:hypothetical protein
MNRARKGEARGFPFRSERMFSVGHEWFYATREGIDQGPFLSRNQAENALSSFIALCLREKAEMACQSA